jgi:hypothetical protein
MKYHSALVENQKLSTGTGYGSPGVLFDIEMDPLIEEAWESAVVSFGGAMEMQQKVMKDAAKLAAELGQAFQKSLKDQPHHIHPH